MLEGFESIQKVHLGMFSHFQKCSFAVSSGFVRHFSSLNIARGCNHLKAWTHPIKQQQQCLESRLTRTSPALIQATSTSTMRLLLLLLGLANFICGHILQTNLINGSYRYKVGNCRIRYCYNIHRWALYDPQEGPYDGPLTGMDQYFAVWGVDSSVTDLYKANPYTETWILNEDGTGLTIAPISPGEEGADILKYQWGKVRQNEWAWQHKNPTKTQEGDTPSPLGSILKTVITLAGPNTVRVVSKDEKAGITDVQIYRFTPAGAQVQQHIEENVKTKLWR